MKPVYHTWNCALGVGPLDFQKRWVSKAAYYDIWGATIAAYGLVQLYDQLGYKDIIMEGILVHPTIDDQIRLLGARQRVDG